LPSRNIRVTKKDARKSHSTAAEMPPVSRQFPRKKTSSPALLFEAIFCYFLLSWSAD